MTTKKFIFFFSLFAFSSIYAAEYDYRNTVESEVFTTKSSNPKFINNESSYTYQSKEISETFNQGAFSYYPYIGIQIGKVTGELEHSNTLTYNQLPGLSLSNSRESSLHGFSSGLTLGYAVSYKNFYGAVEGFYNHYHNTDSDFTYSNLQVSRPSQQNPNVLTTQNLKVVGQDKVNHSYGVNFKLGYFIRHDFLPYFILGYGKTNYTSKLTLDDTFLNSPNEFVLDKFNHDYTGLQYGLGLKYFITQNFSISADYIQADYSAKKITVKESWYTQVFKLTPYKYDFQLGFQYNF